MVSMLRPAFAQNQLPKLSGRSWLFLELQIPRGSLRIEALSTQVCGRVALNRLICETGD
jgi:hypothetical protein